MHTPSRADASGISHCIGDALKQVGVTNVLDSECAMGVEKFPVLVGGGTDGAAVNVAESGGLRSTKTSISLDLLVMVLCSSPRAYLQGCFFQSTFSAIEDLLLRLYYLYERSPKKSSDLCSWNN